MTPNINRVRGADVFVVNIVLYICCILGSGDKFNDTRGSSGMDGVALFSYSDGGCGMMIDSGGGMVMVWVPVHGSSGSEGGGEKCVGVGECACSVYGSQSEGYLLPTRGGDSLAHTRSCLYPKFMD